MRLFLAVMLAAIFLILGASVPSAFASTIQYIGTGKKEAPMEITFSRNNGASWQNVKVVPGQTFAVPAGTTHLNINGVPRDPHKNYKILEGNVY